jgi:hypothetical protein
MDSTLSDHLAHIARRDMELEYTGLCSLDLHALNLVGFIDQCLYDLFDQLPHFHLLLLPEISPRTLAPAKTHPSTKHSIDQPGQSVNHALMKPPKKHVSSED